MDMRTILCVICLGLTAPLGAECLTSLPMPLLEDCILTEAAGRRYTMETRPDGRRFGDELQVLVQRPDKAGGSGASASSSEIAGMIP